MEVLMRKSCAICEGTGTVKSLEYIDWCEKYGTPEEFSQPPVQEVTCSECKGTGTTEYWEDIEDFINLIS